MRTAPCHERRRKGGEQEEEEEEGIAKTSAKMNPESLDSSIQSALSALFPPFEATAPIVLCQLFRTIEERYHGDALQCLLDFLIPSKHLLESVQQAACAGYSDVVFRCEGWPLCLHDKTVIQLAPVNPLLLRPGDFYLQVEPFGEQAARVVLKSLLEEGCREVEETPVPETSYPCIFTEDWLRDINEGRRGTPLSRCLLCTDQGVIKLPWAKIAVPEFLDKPKIMPTHREAPPEPKQLPIPSHYNAATLPVEMLHLPAKDRLSASLRPVDYSSKLVKVVHQRQAPKPCSKSSLKPVGWVSPNTWDSRNYREIEGDYVDLVDVAKGKDCVRKQRGAPGEAMFKPVRPPPPVPLGGPCARTIQYAEEPCTPCSQRNLGRELTDQEANCRYRDSYLAALRNPVPFERGSRDLLMALEEAGLCAEADLKSAEEFEGPIDELGCVYNLSKEAIIRHELCQYKPCCEPPLTALLGGSQSENLMKESPAILKSTPGLSLSQRVPTKLVSHQLEHGAGVHPGPAASPEARDGDPRPQLKSEFVKPAGKHKGKARSLSTVSETSKGTPPLYKLNNRSQSDICPEAVSSIIQGKEGELSDHVALKLERLAGKSLKKESQSTRDESFPAANGAVSNSRLHNSSPAQAQTLCASTDAPPSPQREESSFRSIGPLLEMGLICLPGSRDRTGRAVVEVHGNRKEWTSPFVSAPGVCQLLLYLLSIPRTDVRELGLTLVINARKKPPPLHLYKALLMAQEQALHAVHSIVILMDKDTYPRPEKQPGLQMDMVTSMKALNKTVEASQLTSSLGGTFTYSHTDWMQFRQKLASFTADLRGADSLLQRAIGKVDGSKKTDTAEDVQQCILAQRASMKEVLEDTRLVTLQREGGAALARMRREEFRFPQSEDYRDGLESVTSLYNQVEEKLHVLVMRSNESLEHLEFLFGLKALEAKINTAATWFNTEGEEGLAASSFSADETLEGCEKALRHFETFVTRSKEKQQYALSLVQEGEELVGTGGSGLAADVFLPLISAVKSNIDGFMVRADTRYKELEAEAHVYRHCSQASALAEECGRFLEQVEPGCYSPQTLSTLEMHERRLLGGEFSGPRLQALRNEAHAAGPGGPGALELWNATWVQCQDVRQRLEEVLRKIRAEENQVRPAGQREAPTEDDGTEKEKGSEAGPEERPPSEQPTSPGEPVGFSASAEKNTTDARPNRQSESESNGHQGGEAHEQKSPGAANKRQKPSCDSPQHADRRPGTKQRPRQHRSEADLRSAGTAEACASGGSKCLARSLSEGARSGSPPPCTSGFPPLNVRHKHCWGGAPATNPEKPSSESVRDTSHGVKGGGRAVSADSPGDPETPEALLASTENTGSSVAKLQRIMEELLSTEREYVKALGYVREHYFPELERPDVPQDLRGQRGSIFGNLEKLHDFHRLHFLRELEGCAEEPLRVGRCFLRHRESFALYALYSKNKPQSDRLLINHGQAFFKEKQLSLGDKMDLWSYLLKPVQRISKYGLLLQDMMRECGPAQSREMAEVGASLDVVHFQLRHGNDLLAMDAIRGCDVNLKEQGQLIRQDEFLVTFRKRKCSRHIFLFQELVLFSKTRRTDVGNDTYVYKQSFKTSDIGMTQNSGESGLCFEIWFRKRKTQDTYSLQAAGREVKESWTRDLERILWEQAVHNREVRMQERVFMGIGNKPFTDIQPSDAAISDRAVSYALLGRVPAENRGQLPSCRAPDRRPKSVSSRSDSSSSSSSSGGSSASPAGYRCGPQRTVEMRVSAGYASAPGALEEDDLDHEGGSQSLLLDSSESSGESVSGRSSCSRGRHSAAGGEAEDAGSPGHRAPAASRQSDAPAGSPEKSQAPVPSSGKPEEVHGATPGVPGGKAQNAAVGKSTEV